MIWPEEVWEEAPVEALVEAEDVEWVVATPWGLAETAFAQAADTRWPTR